MMVTIAKTTVKAILYVSINDVKASLANILSRMLVVFTLKNTGQRRVAAHPPFD